MGSNDFIDLVENLVLNKLSEIHTITIAKITKVNSKSINCKPVFKRKLKDREIDYPIFTDVPVINLQGGSSYIAMPYAVGDYCLLLINERCFDNWYEGLDDKAPLEYRMFDYSDSFALVGVNPKSAAITNPSTIIINGDTVCNGDWVINGNLTINDGTITVNNGDVVADGISLKSHTHSGDSGGTTGSPI